MDKRKDIIRKHYLLLIDKGDKYNINKDNNTLEITIKNLTDTEKKQFTDIQLNMEEYIYTKHIITLRYKTGDIPNLYYIYDMFPDAICICSIENIKIDKNKFILKFRKFYDSKEDKLLLSKGRKLPF